MRKRNLPQNEKKQSVRRDRDPIPWRYCFLTLICGAILVGGFFYAARQHFSSMDYSIKNAQLRRQKEDLEADQRRFKLAKEIAFSPAEIKKAARKIGFQDMSAANIQLFQKDETESSENAAKTRQSKPEVKEKPSEKKIVEVETQTQEKKAVEKKEKKSEDGKKQLRFSKNGESGM